MLSFVFIGPFYIAIHVRLRRGSVKEERRFEYMPEKKETKTSVLLGYAFE